MKWIHVNPWQIQDDLPIIPQSFMEAEKPPTKSSPKKPIHHKIDISEADRAELAVLTHPKFAMLKECMRIIAIMPADDV